MESFDILLDENIEPFHDELRDLGHNATHVLDVPELEEGAQDDSDILPWLQANDTILFTQDDHWIGTDSSDPQNAIDPARTAGVLWLKDGAMTPGQQIKAIQVIATLLSAAELNGEYVEVTERWLEYID
jgi:predicted nuclease of predicted toxin-antitoxin system